MRGKGIWPLLVATLALSVAGCSRGKAGAKCSKPQDCAHGHYCHEDKCMAGPETACGYLDRCLQQLSGGQAETLFGEQNDYFRKMVRESPDEPACEAQLKFIASINRIGVLQRACGPRVTTPP